MGADWIDGEMESEETGDVDSETRRGEDDLHDGERLLLVTCDARQRGWAVGSCWLQMAGVEAVSEGVEGAFAACVRKFAV